MNVFDEEWKNKFITTENRFGIDWNGLQLFYQVNYKNESFPKSLTHIGIWHLLFDFIQTKDKEEELQQFCKEVLHWSDVKTDEFVAIGISQGYGSLSFSAINKILPYLQDGFIYSEAVSFANLNSVLGKEIFEAQKASITHVIVAVIKNIDKEKELLTITNGLIQQFFAAIPTNKAKGIDNHIKEMAADETDKKLKSYFGESNWNDKAVAEKTIYQSYVLDKYLRFLDGTQEKEEKASFRQDKNPEIDYYKLPRLDEAIKKTLKTKYGASENGLKKLYHPADIDIYQKSKTGKLEDPNPPSKGWNNPMAMRTMHELRKLVNYFLETGKIDADAKVVVEMARENNNTNYRKAYTDWITDRDNENKAFAKEIAEMLGNVSIADISDDDYNKFRSAVEQIVEQEVSENKGSIFLQKYKEFIEGYLSKANKDIETIEEGKENKNLFDYLMYLILCRDEFSKYLNFKLPNSTKWHSQIIKTSAGFSKKRKELQDMLIKYRLWKQQKFLCFYTGSVIPFTQLFSNNYQIEHTIPRSISFDGELKNLTVCDATYNNNVKNNRFPTECPNYKTPATVQTIQGLKECSPIENRVDMYIKPKVDELKARLKNLQKISKGIPEWEKAKKDANIQLRHYLQFEMEYWGKKLLTFIVKKNEWKDNWKNSQLIDTQIISKYARAYLKTVFSKVDVQKGIITAEFRKIYGIMGDEKKDRTKHSHHAIDAAVLTLIPGSAQREEILKQYYQAIERREKFHIPPYPKFNISHIQTIENNTLINLVSKDQTLSKTKKNVRKRGEIEYMRDEVTKSFIKDKNGKKIPLKMQGDSIRGQLHLESYYGAIKPNEKNETGYSIKVNSEYILKQKNGKDEIWLVHKKPIESVNIEDIIDVLLKRYIQKQLDSGTKITEVLDFNNKRIRHVRYRIKTLTKEKALFFKSHIFPSKHTHKQQYIASNAPGSNYVNILYEGINSQKEIIRSYRIISLFEFSELGLSDVEHLRRDNAYNYVEKGKGKKAINIPIRKIFKVGERVIMWQKSKDELQDLSKDEKLKRLYNIYKFNNSGSDYIFIQHHLEARPDAELGDGDTLFNADKYQPRLKLTADNFNCLIENIDFKINAEGLIE